MTAFWILDVLCLAAIVTSGVLVMSLRNLNGAVIALSTVGMLMSLLFVVLGAPDVAQSEVVVGAIALPVLYLIAIGKIRTAVQDRRELGEQESAAMSDAVADEHARQEAHAAGDDWHRPWAALTLTGATAGALLIGLLGLPRDGAALSAVARRSLDIALPVWGQADPVNEIVYGSRGFDTFGETFILLAAVVAVSTLARAREARGEYVGEATAGREEQAEIDPHGDARPQDEEARRAEEAEEHGTEPLPDPDSIPLGTRAPERSEAMSVVVRVAARAAAVILAVAAIYLGAWGYSPGGGFPAGAAMAGVALLFYAALGHRAVNRLVRPAILEPAEVVGALAIIAIGLVGLADKGALFANWVPLAQPQTILAGGTNQPYSAAEFVEVASGLTIAIFALLGMGHDWAPDPGSDE
jgi:multicomponent Na+:H+ antiporter subunit B